MARVLEHAVRVRLAGRAWNDQQDLVGNGLMVPRIIRQSDSGFLPDGVPIWVHGPGRPGFDPHPSRRRVQELLDARCERGTRAVFSLRLSYPQLGLASELSTYRECQGSPRTTGGSRPSDHERVSRREHAPPMDLQTDHARAQMVYAQIIRVWVHLTD